MLRGIFLTVDVSAGARMNCAVNLTGFSGVHENVNTSTESIVTCSLHSFSNDTAVPLFCTSTSE